MAYTAATWSSPVVIDGNTQIAVTDDLLVQMISTDANSIENYLNNEMQNKIEPELNGYDTRLQTLENIVEW